MKRFSRWHLFLAASALACLFALTSSGQPLTNTLRWNSNPPLALTTAAPTAAPLPEFAPFSTGCYGTGSINPCQGQSQNAALIGAVHLSGCSRYVVAICGDGGTLSGAGTVQIWGWPEFPADAGGLNLWARNPQLDEVVTVSSGTQCQRFAGHSADGLGWIYPAPNAVTVSAGVVSVGIEATCSN